VVVVVVRVTGFGSGLVKLRQNLTVSKSKSLKSFPTLLASQAVANAVVSLTQEPDVPSQE